MIHVQALSLFIPLYPCPANHKIFLEGPYVKTVSIRDLTLSKHSLWHWIFSTDTMRTMVQKYSILHVSISQHFIALGFLIQTRATKWLNCFEAESFCFTPTLIRDEISISSYLKCKPFVINIFWLAKFITHKKFQYLEQSLNRNNEEEACGWTEICGNFNENEILMIPIIYKV